MIEFKSNYYELNCSTKPWRLQGSFWMKRCQATKPRG